MNAGMIKGGGSSDDPQESFFGWCLETLKLASETIASIVCADTVKGVDAGCRGELARGLQPPLHPQPCFGIMKYGILIIQN